MSGLPRSPQPFFRPVSPHRARSPSPNNMLSTPGARRWRATLSSEEFYLRDLSPSATLRAFTEGPSVFDTTRDEYKIYACIENLTAADKELGAKVAKAAERLESWSEEIQQWTWPGTFEPPSKEYVEDRRRSIALHIQEHGGDPRAVDLAPLEYYGSLIATEIKEHEARLDEISEELETLEFDELKVNILHIHGPRETGYGAAPTNYIPLDDFSFLITQTLISSLPHHFLLKERLNTWSARIAVLREVPGYLRELETAKKAMRLAWEAIEPPTDDSDEAFDKWTLAVDTITGVLQNKVRGLGQRLDRMLDTLEGHRDCLPDDWIDVFEGVDADLRRWSSDSRRRIIGFEVLRKGGPSKKNEALQSITEMLAFHTLEERPCITVSNTNHEEEPRPRSVTAFKGGIPVVPDAAMPVIASSIQTDGAPDPVVLGGDSEFEEGDTVVHNEVPDPVVLGNNSEFEEGDTAVHNEMPGLEGSYTSSFGSVEEPHKASSSHTIVTSGSPDFLNGRPQTPTRPGSAASISSLQSYVSSPSIIEDSPTLRKAPRPSRMPRPELNAAMGKRRGPLQIIEDEEINSVVPWPPTQFSGQTPAAAPQDLDSKIEDILNSIPAHIRLTSGEEAESGSRNSARPSLGKLANKSYLRSRRSTNGIKSPELTLSPAGPDSSVPGAAGGRRPRVNGFDNGIKLYHLTQPGREKPIKLFIRRVGEQGERVMVRVGGGWADLGEYLRQYAEHHGRRAISEGKFEILGLEARKEAESIDRPESVAGGRSGCASGLAGRTSTTPQKARRMSTLRNGATPPPMPDFVGTPTMGSPIVDPGSPAPSTDSTHRSWTGEEVGLAGPRVKPLNLDGQKMEWIEGMMKQARSVSNSNLTTTWNPKMDGLPTGGREGADSRPVSRNGVRKGGNSRPQSRNGPGPARKQPSFGDLGKVGGTKRVFFRGSGVPDK